ncbi:unnamed protein product [Protopolystoma xenopodis]|uniref:Uncharacterized protein n=1 Tax=Protopolystoma xenopodis TaxID=117903 RepID=A0A3S5A7D3_9PLAT|nr:unnamed protein product [Protopolystoma xenopodis]
MAPKWFANHVAYTMAKYGMSMCVLGMAEELKRFGIAVNALWPRTAIYTAATKMLAGGEHFAKQCRHPEIMSDAAHIVLTLPASDSQNTGRFFIDDELLAEHGIVDLEKYSVQRGASLALDFFLDSVPGATDVSSILYQTSVASTFEKIRGLLTEDLVQQVSGTFYFNLIGEHLILQPIPVILEA